MKKYLISFVMLSAISICVNAQVSKEIKLNDPDLTRGSNIMEAFSKRSSVREYSEKNLSLQDLSDLIWAAIGINRPESGKLTAPTAMNDQEISLYVCFKEGVYLYDAKKHSLILVTEGDLRPVLAERQDFVKTAPVVLVIVADTSKFYKNSTKGEKELYCAIDAGIVSQNISIFCAGTNMGTVPRGWMNKEEFKKILNLNDSQIVYLNHPIGYLK